MADQTPRISLVQRAAELHAEALTTHASTLGYRAQHTSWENLPERDRALLLLVAGDVLHGLGVEKALARAIRESARANQLAATVERLTGEVDRLTGRLTEATWEIAHLTEQAALAGADLGAEPAGELTEAGHAALDAS